MGGAFIVLQGYACGSSFTLKWNPLTLLNLYTINSPSRSFYKPNGQNSLPFQILQLEKVSPLSHSTLPYKTALRRAIIDWPFLEGPCRVVYLTTYRSHEGCYSWVWYRKTQPLHRTRKISWFPFLKVARWRSSLDMCGYAMSRKVRGSLQLTLPIEENIVGHGNTLCARSGFLMFLREPQ